MCYDNETCTVTCPASRKRRDTTDIPRMSNITELALGFSRKDGVEWQENGLPGKHIESFIFCTGELFILIFEFSDQHLVSSNPA